MANVIEPTEEQKKGWDTWVSERPEKVRNVILKHGLTPWKLYRLRSGHRVTLYSIDEPKEGEPTVKVDVLGRFNLVAFDRRVFGVKPEDLEECELPSLEEPLGTVLTADETHAAVEGVPPGEPRVRAILDAAMTEIGAMRPRGDG